MSSRMDIWELHDCSGFRSSSVCSFVHARQKPYHAEPEINNALKALAVHGTGPLLSADDAAFFLEEEANEDHGGGPVTRIEWNVVGRHSNIPDGYTTDLRSADEMQPVIPTNILFRYSLVQVPKSAMYTIDAVAFNQNT